MSGPIHGGKWLQLFKYVAVNNAAKAVSYFACMHVQFQIPARIIPVISMPFVRGKDYSPMVLLAPVSLHSLKELVLTVQVHVNPFRNISSVI